jgi:hypothetical protein
LTSHYVQPPTDSILLFHSPTTSETLRQLHKRFEHVNVKTIINMINDNVAEGLPTNRPSFDSTHFEYPYYVAGKSTRLSFRKVDSTTENRLSENLKVRDKIHSDQKRPITLISHSKNQFLIIFINTRSRIAFIYFMTRMARTILIHSRMETKYWEDVVIHSNYIRNQVITRVLKRMIPYEKFW